MTGSFLYMEAEGGYFRLILLYNAVWKNHKNPDIYEYPRHTTLGTDPIL